MREMEREEDKEREEGERADAAVGGLAVAHRGRQKVVEASEALHPSLGVLIERERGEGGEGGQEATGRLPVGLEVGRAGSYPYPSLARKRKIGL